MSQPKKAIGKKKPKKYVLCLYVAGLSPRSMKAIENIRKICDEHLQGRYELVIQDIYQNPIIAKDGQILAAPTLVKKLPLPLRKFVGDMSDTLKLLVGLDLRSKE
jgi:circadian clock protein KaiB